MPKQLSIATGIFRKLSSGSVVNGTTRRSCLLNNSCPVSPRALPGSRFILVSSSHSLLEKLGLKISRRQRFLPVAPRDFLTALSYFASSLEPGLDLSFVSSFAAHQGSPFTRWNCRSKATLYASLLLGTSRGLLFLSDGIFPPGRFVSRPLCASD